MKTTMQETLETNLTMVDETQTVRQTLNRERMNKPMDGTASQIQIVRDAMQNKDATLGELAERNGYSVQWVEQVLLRVTEEFVAEHVNAGDTPKRDVTQTAEIEFIGDTVALSWTDHDGTRWTELTGTEYCSQCNENRRVLYAVPKESIVYLQGKQCEHSPRIDTDPPEWTEKISKLRNALRAYFEGGANDVRNMNAFENL